MARIICVGDLHIADRPPSSCTDTYLDDIFDILRHVARLERELDADAVVWAGDIFHHKQPSRTSHRTMLRTIEIVREYRNLLLVVGNHDIQNDRVASIFESQPFGVLVQAGARLLDGWHHELPLFGVPWQQDWTFPGTPQRAFRDFREPPTEPAIGEEDWVDPPGHDPAKSLVVTHAPIYPPGLELEFEFVPTRGPDGITAAMGDRGYLYYGHIHESHGIFEVGGVTYANHGAISRGSLHEYNLHREIAVTLWEPSTGFTKVPVPHRPASEVFRLAEAQAGKEKGLSLDSFLSSVGQAQLEITSVESVVAHIQGLGLDPEVARVATELLREQT